MSELTNFTLAEARDAVHKKKVSSKELTTAFIKAVVEARPLNAFVTETPERALEMAVASDVRIAHGEARPLEGLPLAIKDLFCTKGVTTTAGRDIPVKAATVCVHSDTPSAVSIAAELARVLRQTSVGR